MFLLLSPYVLFFQGFGFGVWASGLEELLVVQGFQDHARLRFSAQGLSSGRVSGLRFKGAAQHSQWAPDCFNMFVEPKDEGLGFRI